MVALNDHPFPPPQSSPPRSTNHLSGKRMHQGSSCGCGPAAWSRCLLCLAETTPAPACGERQHLPPQQKGKEGPGGYFRTSSLPPPPRFLPTFLYFGQTMDENILSFAFDVDRFSFLFFHVGTFDGCTKFGVGGGCEVTDDATSHVKERQRLAFQCLLIYAHVCPKITFNPDWHAPPPRLLSFNERQRYQHK